MKRYIEAWIKDWMLIFSRELRHIFSDGGVMVIFFLAGLVYPLLYGIIYHNGTVDDMPVAVIDASGSAVGREFIRKLDATRELAVTRSCHAMAEAEKLMQEREVHGIVLIPEDFDLCLAEGRQAHVSTYADMSSFLYYKNLSMGVNNVMLDSMREMSPLPQPVLYEASMPYNRTFSYTLFFLSAVLLIVIQQTMFYGISMLTGTMREENRSFAVLSDTLKGRGISRTVMGRGAAYWLLYMAIGIYVAVIVPAVVGLPRNCSFGSIIVLLLFYVTACTVFSFTFSSFVRHRETVFVLFLFMSPVCLFLTGFAWPQSNFPRVWEAFSWIFPSTFAVRAFINMNTAGASLGMAGSQIAALSVQIIVYYFLSCTAVFIELLPSRSLSSARQTGLSAATGSSASNCRKWRIFFR